MATAIKKNVGLSSCDSGNGTENERRKFTKSAAGAVLVLMEVAVPAAVLVLVVLSVLVSLCG